MPLRELAAGKRILDCFCYTGGFLHSRRLGGAKELVLIDSSEEALRMAEVHFDLNRLRDLPHRLIRGNVFEIDEDP